MSKDGRRSTTHAFAYSREYSESDVFPRLFAHPCLSPFDICIKKKTWNIFILICTYGCTVHLQKPNMKLCINRKVKSKQLLYPLLSISAVRVIKKRRIVRTKYVKVALAGDIPASFSGPSPWPLTFYGGQNVKKERDESNCHCQETMMGSATALTRGCRKFTSWTRQCVPPWLAN